MSGGYVIGRSICFGLMAGLTVSDLRCRQVPCTMLGMGGVLALAHSIACGESQWALSAFGLLVGICFLAVSRVTREGLGYGDSLLICILGIYLGVWKLFELLLSAWTLAAVAAMCVLVRKHGSKRATMPMVPFLTIGYVILWGSELIGT